MSTTRLVVLGAVKQFQPVHGYFLRRELMTWHVDEWAHIQPGSIYNALRALEVDGYIAESGTEAEGKRPARTTYRITPAGESSCSACCARTSGTSQPSTPRPS